MASSSAIVRVSVVSYLVERLDSSQAVKDEE